MRASGAYTLSAGEERLLDKGSRLGWLTVTAEATGLRIGDTLVEAADLGSNGVVLQAEDYGAIHVARRAGDKYQASLQLAGALRFSRTADGAVRVVNLVDVESYVAGVVPNEASSRFSDEALKGQAVVARTYALYIMSERAAKPYDLRASEGDQVYRGIRTDAFGQRAVRAVDATRSLVLAWSTAGEERAFCTFYSAACGGMSQSIADVQSGDAPAPLRGGVSCDYCKIGGRNVYRWGPTEIAKADLLERLKSRDEAFADWKTIESVVVAAETDTGRVGRVALVGDDGQRASLIGERFRLAVGSRVMRSTACDLIDAGDRLKFENGQGFGHGVGLCQWGMEGQAREGKRAGEILRYYYPGARLVRAY